MFPSCMREPHYITCLLVPSLRSLSTNCCTSQSRKRKRRPMAMYGSRGFRHVAWLRTHLDDTPSIPATSSAVRSRSLCARNGKVGSICPGWVAIESSLSFLAAQFRGYSEQFLYSTGQNTAPSLDSY